MQGTCEESYPRVGSREWSSAGRGCRGGVYVVLGPLGPLEHQGPERAGNELDF